MTSQPQPTVRRGGEGERHWLVALAKGRGLLVHRPMAGRLRSLCAWTLPGVVLSQLRRLEPGEAARMGRPGALSHDVHGRSQVDKIVREHRVFHRIPRSPSSSVVALFTALLLNRQLPGIGVFRTLFYLPSVTAGVATAILWRFVFNYRYGLFNQALGMLGIQGPNWLGEYQVGDAGIYHHEHMGFRQLDGALSGRLAGRAARALRSSGDRWPLPRGTDCSK